MVIKREVSIVIILLIGVALFIFYPGEENETELVIYNKIGEANPAAGYCSALGYETDRTRASAYCVFPDKSECEQWNFYRGECGQEWSYCKLQGYELKDFERLEGWDKGAVCLDGNTGEEIGNVYDLVNAEFISQNK